MLTVIRTFAAFADVKDFRVGVVLRRLRMDPRQPALLYRRLVLECREALAMSSELEALRRRLREAAAECEALTQSRNETRASIGVMQAEHDAQLRSLEQALDAHRRRVLELEAKLRDAFEAARRDQRLTSALAAFLAGSLQWKVLREICDLIQDAYVEALDEFINPRLGLPTRLRTVDLKNLRILLTEVMRIFNEHRGPEWDAASSYQARHQEQRLLPTQREPRQWQ